MESLLFLHQEEREKTEENFRCRLPPSPPPPTLLRAVARQWRGWGAGAVTCCWVTVAPGEMPSCASMVPVSK
jgi:hypothetical protein